MPVNRNALIRYKTLDKCLQNRYRKWTLEDLIDACSDALYEYEGIDKGVSKRTVQADIQIMRSNKLGYNAPIIVLDKKYYTYEDPEYSITNIPLTDQDLGMLTDAVAFMKQFKGFSHFRELDTMVQKLEDHIYSQKTQSKPVIDFEKNERLKGLEYLDQLYQAIIKKKPILLTYQSFKARNANSFIFHPYLLKEYRNRWFLLGVKEANTPLLNLALDRIISISDGKGPYVENEGFDPQEYYKNAIGISVSPNLQPQEVTLFVTHAHAPYIITKPLHHSQKILDRDNYGVTISLTVQHNFELEKEILGFGDGIRVIAPERLKRSIIERITAGMDHYNTELSSTGLKSSKRKLKHKGHCTFNYVYTKRELKKINKLLTAVTGSKKQHPQPIYQLLKRIPELKEVLFNNNLKKIIATIDPKAFNTKSFYTSRVPQSSESLTFHQRMELNVESKVATKGFTKWKTVGDITSVQPPADYLTNSFTITIHLDGTSLENGFVKVVPGSHNKVHTAEDTRLIGENSNPTNCVVLAGGIYIHSPLLLKACGKTNRQKFNQQIHLDFSSKDLPGSLEYAERETFEIPG